MGYCLPVSPEAITMLLVYPIVCCSEANLILGRRLFEVVLMFEGLLRFFGGVDLVGVLV
jgi:hypothetical protein